MGGVYRIQFFLDVYIFVYIYKEEEEHGDVVICYLSGGKIMLYNWKPQTCLFLVSSS